MDTQDWQGSKRWIGTHRRSAGLVADRRLTLSRIHDPWSCNSPTDAHHWGRSSSSGAWRLLRLLSGAPTPFAARWPKMAQVIGCNPRRYLSYTCVDGLTKVTTHMEVRMYDAHSSSVNKMINVLVDVHRFEVGNGLEKALFKVYSLKEALRRSRACYNQLAIYVYKGKLDGNNRMDIDTDMNGPHDGRLVLDVLADDELFPQDWLIYVEGKEYPRHVYAWCFVEPLEDYMEVTMDTTHLLTAGELKRELKKALWPDMQEIPSYYLAQIQVYYTEEADTRVFNDVNLNMDPAARRHNHFVIRVTDCIGQKVPRGHIARPPVQARDGDPPEALRWVVHGRLPPLHRSVDCSFEYPRTFHDGTIEGFDAPTRHDVSYFNVQPGTTAAAAVTGAAEVPAAGG